MFGREDRVTITNREIYDSVLQTKAATEAVLAKISALEVRDTDHETRLRGLEQARWRLAGVVAVVCFAGSAIISAVLGG